MATMHLHPNPTPGRVRSWYQGATTGDTAVITMPHNRHTVRLIRQGHEHVHWWLEGERGVTVPLQDAIYRLQLLGDSCAQEPEQLGNYVLDFNPYGGGICAFSRHFGKGSVLRSAFL